MLFWAHEHTQLTGWLPGQALKPERIKPGQRVLVHAGAGGVGHMAIQLAKLKGAYVITTGRNAYKGYLEVLGCQQCCGTVDMSKIVEASTAWDAASVTLHWVRVVMGDQRRPRAAIFDDNWQGTLRQSCMTCMQLQLDCG